MYIFSLSFKVLSLLYMVNSLIPFLLFKFSGNLSFESLLQFSPKMTVQIVSATTFPYSLYPALHLLAVSFLFHIEDFSG